MSERNRTRIAVLASGSGSTMEAFVHACEAEAGIIGTEVSLVISNNSSAGAFQRVHRLNKQYGIEIETLHISGQTHPGGTAEKGAQTLQESAAIFKAIERNGVALVCLMGYMKKVRGKLLDEYGWKQDSDIETARLINTHPGPLPQTEGLHGIHVQEEVLRIGLGYSAQTLHVVAEHYDQGPIIAEHRVPVITGDTPESLFESVQLTEKANLPVDIGQFLEEIRYYND